MSKTKKAVIIPARLESSRLHGKLLLDLGGMSILHRAYTQCKQANSIDAVYIATDNRKIADQCGIFTENVIMTSTAHESGTDRIAEAARHIDCDIIVNVQGDEPFIEPELIEMIASALDDEEVSMSSAMSRVETTKELIDPNVVKVVVDKEKYALYFSRSVIPHHRDGWQTLIQKHDKIPDSLNFFRHIGIYGFKKKFLLRYSSIEQSYLERLEKLEQLRVLENGYRIKMVETEHTGFGIDTQDDYIKALERIKIEQ